jgi:NAD(P)-dependent dehydrogenase (short-subunit alcohol dehydrogenase family)
MTVKVLNNNKLENKSVYIAGGNEKQQELLKKIYQNYGAVIVNNSDAPIDVYCLISPVSGNYFNVVSNEFDFEESEKIIKAMTSRENGTFVLIANSMGHEHVVSSKWAREEGEQAKVITWWKSMTTVTAKHNVRGNIISLGYAPFWEERLDEKMEEELMRKLSMKRFATEDDLKYALYYLSTDESSYVVGEILNIDGGLHRRVIIDIRGCKEFGNNKGFDLTDRTILVIGASSGMGKSVVRTLSERGAKVILCSRNLNALNDLSEEIRSKGKEAKVYKLDVTDVNECKTVFDTIYDETEKLDGVVYASGFYSVEKFYKSNSIWDKVMDTNFRGLVKVADLYLNKCIERNDKGSLVAIASVATDTVPVSNSEAYIASKAAMKHFIQSLSVSYARNGIRMNCVAPGCTDTPMIDQVSEEYRKMWLECIPSKKLGQPEDMAKAVGYLVSDAASYVNGETIKVDGGFSLGNLNFVEKENAYE